MRKQVGWGTRGWGASQGNVHRKSIRLSQWSLSAQKADGTTVGKNTPLTNPWIDLSGTPKANGTLVGFSGTAVDSWVVRTAPNGKSVTGLKADGSDAYVIFPTETPSPVGTQDFGYGFLLKTGPTLFTQIVMCRNTDSSLSQVSFILTADGGVEFRPQTSGLVVAPPGTILPDSFYTIRVIRKSGRLKVYIDSVKTFDAANTMSLILAPNMRLFARSTNVDGTTHGGFSSVILFELMYNDGTDIDKWEAAFINYIFKKYYEIVTVPETVYVTSDGFTYVTTDNFKYTIK